MKLIDKSKGDKELLERLSTLMWHDFIDFLEANDVSDEERDIFKEWLKENGIKTYC